MRRLMALLLFMMFGPMMLNAKTFYVRFNGDDSHDGLSWGNARRNVQSAIDDAEVGDEVWVANGCYESTRIRECGSEYLYASSFILKDGVSLYGGFLGNEIHKEERERDGGALWEMTYITALTVPIAAPGSVLYPEKDAFDHTTVIDGFTLLCGMACGAGKDGCGGGALLPANAILQNCIVENNLARDGGGVATLGAASVRQCFIRGNEVIDEGWGGCGGGIACFGDGARVENSVLFGNGEACGVLYGGGLYSEGSSQIIFCTIVGNVASRHGSGVVLDGASRMVSSIVWGNRGGSIQVAAPSSTVAGCAIGGQLLAGGNVPLDDSNYGSGGLSANDNRVDRYYVCFTNPDIGDFRLGMGSYAINRGFVSNESLPDWDAAGNPRTQQSVPDIGAFESPYIGNLAVEFEVSLPCIYKSTSFVKPVLGLCSPADISLQILDLTDQSDWVEANGGWSVCWNHAGVVELWMTASVSGKNESAWDYVALTRTLTVAKRPIGVSAIDVVHSFGEALPELRYEVTAGSLAEGDSFKGTLACEIEDLLEKSYPITQGTLNIEDGEQGRNYTIIFKNGKLTYKKAIANMSLEAATLDYTGQACAPIVTTVPANLTLICHYRGTGDTVYPESGLPPKDAGTYVMTITIDDPHFAGTLETDIVISPIPLSVTADDKSRMYMEPNPELTLSFSGFVQGDSEADITLPVVSTTATEASLPGNYPITLSGGSARNYLIVPHAGTMQISKANLKATVYAQSIAYGDKVGDALLQGTATLAFSNYNVAGVFAWDEPERMLEKGIHTLNWSFTPALTDRFEPTSGSFELTINPMELYLSADAKSIYYGQADLPLTYTITAGHLVAGDAFTGALAREEGNTAGEYLIGIGTLALNENYNLHYTSALYTILKASLSNDGNDISVNAIVYGEPLSASSITGTMRNANNGEAVTGRFVWETPDAVLTAGTHDVVCRFIADDEADYEAFSFICSITVEKALFGITSVGAGKIYGEADPVIPYTVLNGMPASIHVSGAPGRAEGEAVGEYELTVGTLELDNPNYSILFTSDNCFAIEPRSLGIAAVATGKIYGEGDPSAFEYTISNAMAGDDLRLSGALARVAGENAGTYEIQLGTLAVGNGNYVIDYESALFTIAKRVVTIALRSYSIGEFEDEPEYEYDIVSGELLDGDVITGTAVREPGKVGVFAITRGTLAINDNYELIVEEGEITLNEESIQAFLESVGTLTFGHKVTELDISVYGISTYSGKRISGHAEWVYPNQTLFPPKGTTTVRFVPDAPYTEKTVNFTILITVEKARFTLKADDIIMQACDPVPELTYSIIDGEIPSYPINGKLKLEDPRAIYTANTTTAILRGSLTIVSYYEMEFITGTLTVTPRYITIEADNAYKYEGEDDPELTYSITNGSLRYSSHITGSLEREPGEEPGTYLITAETLNLPTPLYSPAYINGTFTILPGPRPTRSGSGQTRDETVESYPQAMECVHVASMPIPGVESVSTLEEAMELVAENGEIILHPGTYAPAEGWLAVNRNVHLRGEMDAYGNCPVINGYLFIYGREVNNASFASLDILSSEGPAVVLQDGASNVAFRNAYLQGEEIAVNAYQAGCVRFEESILDASDLGILFIRAPEDESFFETIEGAEFRSTYDMVW